MPHARLSFRLPVSFGFLVPTLDAWTKSPPSSRGRLSSQAGEVTLRFCSAVLSSTEAVDAFASLPLPVTSPAGLHLASSFLRIPFFGLAGDQVPFSTGCCRACPAGDETPAVTELCIACPTGNGCSDVPRILHPAARAAKRISGFFRSSSSCVAGNVLSKSLRCYQLK
jgi:hypothetical protein